MTTGRNLGSLKFIGLRQAVNFNTNVLSLITPESFTSHPLPTAPVPTEGGAGRHPSPCLLLLLKLFDDLWDKKGKNK
jgi:hypothetical protein